MFASSCVRAQAASLIPPIVMPPAAEETAPLAGVQQLVLRVILGGHSVLDGDKPGYFFVRPRAVYAAFSGQSDGIFWASDQEPVDTLPDALRELTITYNLVANLDVTETQQIINSLRGFLKYTVKVVDWTVVFTYRNALCLNQNSALWRLVESLRFLVDLHTPMEEHCMVIKPHLAPSLMAHSR